MATGCQTFRTCPRILGLFRRSLLFLIMVEDRGPVLGSLVGETGRRIRRVNLAPEGVQESLIGYLGRS